MSLQEKIENLETDLHLMGRLVLDSLVDGVRALEDKDVNRAIATIEKDDEIDDDLGDLLDDDSDLPDLEEDADLDELL